MSRWIVGLGSLVALTYAVRTVRRQSALRRERLESRHREEQLDDALEETFPASDPPAMTNPHC